MADAPFGYWSDAAAARLRGRPYTLEKLSFHAYAIQVDGERVGHIQRVGRAWMVMMGANFSFFAPGWWGSPNWRETPNKSFNRIDDARAAVKRAFALLEEDHPNA
jgi:hypothetical protein